MYEGSLLAAAIWAAEAPSVGDGFMDALLKGGPFAVVLALIIFDKLGTNSERDRLREEVKTERAKNQELNDTVRSEVIAPLAEHGRLNSGCQGVMSKDVAERKCGAAPNHRAEVAHPDGDLRSRNVIQIEVGIIF